MLKKYSFRIFSNRIEFLEDTYIICSYIYKSNNKFLSLYKILSQYLTEIDRYNRVRSVFQKNFYLLLKSLRKIPKYYSKDKFCIEVRLNL